MSGRSWTTCTVPVDTRRLLFEKRVNCERFREHLSQVKGGSFLYTEVHFGGTWKSVCVGGGGEERRLCLEEQTWIQQIEMTIFTICYT